MLLFLFEFFYEKLYLAVQGRWGGYLARSMSIMNKLLFLGSGGSMGVPVIGCLCEVCTSNAPKNKRLRPSVLLKFGKKHFVIDMGPDYRQQALKYHINTLDGLLLTHTHYDHIGGLDELRIYAFRSGKAMPCLLSRETLEALEKRYDYLFSSHEVEFNFHVLENGAGKILFEGVKVGYFSYMQVGMQVTGFRFNKLAYITDILEYEESIFQHLQGIETLIISAQQYSRSKAHLHIEQIIEFSKKTEVKHTYFTHISHEIHHEKIQEELPKGFFLAYDGMECIL